MDKYYVCGINSMNSKWYLGSKDADSCDLWPGAPEEMRAAYDKKIDAESKAKELDQYFKFASTRHYVEKA